MFSQEQQQAIREAAYLKWEAAGCPCGEELRFWLEAENEHPFDVVEEASEESFPASDTPSWIPLSATPTTQERKDSGHSKRPAAPPSTAAQPKARARNSRNLN